MKLDPYPTWSPEAQPVDPRDGDLAGVADVIERIVATEGPMLLSLVIRRYIAATPNLSRAGGAIRTTMRRAAERLASTRRVELVDELSESGEEHTVLRIPDQPLLPRQRGDRSLHEIPISELAAMLVLVRFDRGVSNYTETVQRALLGALDLIRLTAATRERLLVAWRVSGRWLDDGHRDARAMTIETRPLPDNPRREQRAKPAPQSDPDVPSWQAALRGTPFTTRRSE